MIPPYKYRNRTYHLIICAKDGAACGDSECEHRHEVIEVVPLVTHEMTATASQRQSIEIQNLQNERRRLINGPDHPAVKRWAASQGDA